PSLLKNGIVNKPIDVIEKPEIDYDEVKQSEESVKLLLKKNKEAQIKLNTAWFSQLTDTEAVLREKMTFFWHDHFACRVRNAYLGQQQINTIRTHAVGKFGDLLMSVSKDPGMLQFLNNQQNKKDSPNENFAREVMELFTLGRGNYSEQDIKNAARAFTGWAFNPLTGEFLFRQRQHDFGSKTFRGKTGNFSGENIIGMILEDKQTASFITTKICNFFVGSELEKSILNELSNSFYQSGYDIHKLLLTIYSSDWFYEEKFKGNRIKSPVELIAGIQVHTNGTFNNPLNMVFLQKGLGQVLLQPPNVGGWPSGKEWIDSSSLTFRMSLPTLLMRNASSNFEAKDDGDANDGTNAAAKPGQMSYSVDWVALGKMFHQSTSEKTLEGVENFLLAKPTTQGNRKMIAAFAETGKTEPEFLKNAFIGYMSLPEYQLN
ncbi:MAG TPA: DUF1800 domain-containing protein, partial [Cyclobacteriaceae bacterium]